MMARDRRYGKSPVKTRIGIATAILVGGAVAAGAFVASDHGASSTATSAAYSSGYNSEGNMLNSALSDWSWSPQSSYSDLSSATQGQWYTQASHQGKTLVVQRGIVVVVTPKFLILKSKNGSLHLWLLSGDTKFKNVSSDSSGTYAMTGNNNDAYQAMHYGNMDPATTLLAGSSTTAADLLTASATAQTVKVQVANTNLTVTVRVTSSTATVFQSATPSWTGMPSWHPTTWTQNAWMPMNGLARGDLALVVGSRSHWTLKAQLILFTPLSSSDVSGYHHNNNNYSNDNNNGNNSTEYNNGSTTDQSSSAHW